MSSVERRTAIRATVRRTSSQTGFWETTTLCRVNLPQTLTSQAQRGSFRFARNTGVTSGLLVNTARAPSMSALAIMHQLSCNRILGHHCQASNLILPGSRNWDAVKIPVDCSSVEGRTRWQTVLAHRRRSGALGRRAVSSSD